MAVHWKPEATVIEAPAPVTASVANAVMVWVETDDGQTPILYFVDRNRLTPEQFHELRVQATEWTARLNASPLRLI